jgi:serine-type D-Ala-D-Ala carboxypeptidase (penicillin-binding protein 5/6)
MTETNIPKKNRGRLPAVLVLVVLVFSSGIMVSGRLDSMDKTQAVEPSPVVVPTLDVEVRAYSAYVYDTRFETVLYAKNENAKLPLASLVKIMSALTATELAMPESTVTVTAEALKERGDSGLRLNERWKLKDILDFSLTTSSNDGMKAVALALGALSQSNASPDDITADFVRSMNELAVLLGMNDTKYRNVTGLDESGSVSGGLGTAKDMATLLDYIVRNKPEILEATREPELTFRSLDNIVHKAKNTGYIVTDIPGVKASKTGFTNLAGGNLAVVFDPEMGRPIIIVVLGSTASDRFEDVLNLMRATMEALNPELNVNI